MYGARNPFLAMLAAINDGDKVEQPLNNGAQQQQQGPGKVQLSEFGRRRPNWCYGFQRALRCDGPGGESALKGCLVLAHQLTQVQKATRCLQVVAGSNQRTSEVLALLLEFCLPDEEGTAFFRAAFTMRLPMAIQANPAGTELTDLKELAQTANPLWLCHEPQPVAAVSVEEDWSEEDQ